MLRSNETGHVFLHSNHVYTNVTMFKEWIIQTVNLTGGVVGEARTNIIMNCDYDYRNMYSLQSSYSCALYNIDVQGNTFETGSFEGAHRYSHTENEVVDVHFVNFEQISRVDLRGNDCINAVHMEQKFINDTVDNLFENLVEFQRHVMTNCSTGVQ